MTLAKPDEVDEWARLLHAAPELRSRLTELARRQGVELTEWKRRVAPGRRKVQEEIRALEAAASAIWVFAPQVVPGLAQTGAYAAVMFRLGQGQALSPEELAGAVQARLARQAVLGDRAKRLKLLFTESALRRSLLPASAMRDQLQRMVEVARLPNVEMGMVAFSTRERTHIYHGFSIIGDPDVDRAALVLAETVTSSLRVRDPDEVRQYVEHYRRLAEGALFGDELVAFLQEISARSPWS